MWESDQSNFKALGIVQHFLTHVFQGLNESDEGLNESDSQNLCAEKHIFEIREMVHKLSTILTQEQFGSPRDVWSSPTGVCQPITQPEQESLRHTVTIPITILMHPRDVQFNGSREYHYSHNAPDRLTELDKIGLMKASVDGMLKVVDVVWSVVEWLAMFLEI